MVVSIDVMLIYVSCLVKFECCVISEKYHDLFIYKLIYLYKLNNSIVLSLLHD